MQCPVQGVQHNHRSASCLQLSKEHLRSAPQAQELLSTCRAALSSDSSISTGAGFSDANSMRSVHTCSVAALIQRFAGRFVHHMAGQSSAAPLAAKAMAAAGRPDPLHMFADTRALYQQGKLQQAMHNWSGLMLIMVNNGYGGKHLTELLRCRTAPHSCREWVRASVCCCCLCLTARGVLGLSDGCSWCSLQL